MENASKALLISAEILIAMAVITIGIYLYTIFNNISTDYSEEMKAKKVLEFNERFLQLQGREDITPQEIITLVSSSIEKSKKTTDKVNIYIDGTNIINEFNIQSNKKENMLKEDLLLPAVRLKTLYKFETLQYNEDGKVKAIYFKKQVILLPI